MRFEYSIQIVIKKAALIILFPLLFFSKASASGNLLLFEFRATGVDEELAEACSEIFSYALSEQGVYIAVRAAEAVGDHGCSSPGCAGGIAAEAGFEKALTGSLVRLGNKIVVNVELIDAAEDRIESALQGTSDSEEDLDVVLRRLAKGISTGKTMEDTAEVGMITEGETEPDRRRTSFTTKGIRAGFMWPFDDSYGMTERLTAVDFVVQHDIRDYFLAAKAGLKWGDHSALDITFLKAKLGRYLRRGDFSPFVSAGLGLQYSRMEVIMDPSHPLTGEDTVSGTDLSLCAGAGIALFRTYDFQFQLDLDYSIMLRKLKTRKGDGGYPQGLIFTFCLKY